MKNIIDYRIIPYHKIRKRYSQYLDTQRIRKDRREINEFEPKIYSIEQLEHCLDFEIASIIILFIPYLSRQTQSLMMDSNLSCHAVSLDYHGIVKNILSKFEISHLSEAGVKSYAQCDTGIFNERFFAIQSGLCKKGLNGMAIHSHYGSYGFLGLIATNKLLDEKTNPVAGCIACNRCINHCPSNAILSNGMKSNRCLSYLTQKKELSPEEKNLLRRGTKIYGCDVCQAVCPENSKINYSEIEDFQKDLMYNIELEEILSMSNKEFRRKFGNRNFAWRGKVILQRNIELLEDE